MTHLRPARGQAIPNVANPIIDLSHLHPGTRARFTVIYVDALLKGLFVGVMANYVHTNLRGETLGADPSRQKRGPRTSNGMRLRGRLPTSLALPRRARVTTMGPYRYELNTAFLSISVTVELQRTKRMNLLTVGLVVARTARGGAMAMAMALKGGRDIGTVPRSFTPILTTLLRMAISVYNLAVWEDPLP